LLKALVLIPVTTASLRILGFRRTKSLLLSHRLAGHADTNLPKAKAIARVVHGAAPWSPITTSCLPRALVLSRLLAQRGLQGELRLGAGKHDGAFAAHAWVEHDGVALAEPESTGQQFTAFDSTTFSRSA